MFQILKSLGKNTVTWDSTFETGMTLPPGAVVHDYEGLCENIQSNNDTCLVGTYTRTLNIVWLCVVVFRARFG